MKRIIRLLALASALLVFASIPMSSYAVIKYDLFLAATKLPKKSRLVQQLKNKVFGRLLIIFKPGYNTSKFIYRYFSQQPIENNVTSEA